MRFVSLLLAISSLMLLNSCGSSQIRAKHKAPVLTGVTEYYHRGSKPSSFSSAAPLPPAPVKPGGWARFTAPGATRPRTPSAGATNPRAPRVRILSLIHFSSPAQSQVSSTHPPTFANSDGTTSKVVGNALVRSDGTSDTMIGNTVFHSNGATSRIVGDTLINADGSQSSRINVNP